MRRGSLGLGDVCPASGAHSHPLLSLIPEVQTGKWELQELRHIENACPHPPWSQGRVRAPKQSVCSAPLQFPTALHSPLLGSHTHSGLSAELLDELEPKVKFLLT